MKKTFQLSLIVLSVFLLGGCTLKKTNDQVQDKTQTKQSKIMSLKDLISSGMAQKCTWSFEEGQDNKMTGQILVKGKKFNQTSIVDGPQGQIEFRSVSDGEYVYSWSDNPAAGNMAFKMKLEESENQSSDNPGQINWENQYDFDCNSTVLSDSDFNPPQGIEFIDMNDFAEQMKDSFSIEE